MSDPAFETDREFDILEWGVVLNQADPDTVVHLKQQFIDGEIPYESFKSQLNTLAQS